MNIDYLLNVNEDGAEGNPIFFSENDIYFNWDKWLTGESHILFVDGLSGSGKSTLAKKLANQYDAEYVEIDVIAFKIVGQKAVDRGHCNYDYIRDQDPFLWKYMKFKHIPPDFLAHLSIDDQFRHTDKEEEYKREEIDKYIHWLCFEQKEKVVIEGGHAGVTITRHPENYENFPIVFKGTSLSKSVLRRMIRAGKKGKFYTPWRWFSIIKIQYFGYMWPEVNEARKKILDGQEDKMIYVKEYYTIDDMVQFMEECRQWIEDKFTPKPPKKPVNEGSMKFGTIDLDIGKEKDTLHHKAKDKTKVPGGIKDFKDFCQKIKDPFMSMRWFIKNKIKWTPNGGSNDHPFQWPDWLIKQKMGNCFDQTIFMHYYCLKKRIEHKMFLITWIADNGQGSGHAVPVFKKGNYCYIWFYLRPGVGHVAGPFRNWDECQKMMNQYFLFYMNRCFGSPCDVYSSYLDEHDMKEFDQYYGDRKILQSEYIMEGLGKHMRSSHMLKIKANGFTFPNPALPIYDAVIYAYKMLMFSNKIIPLWDDEDIKKEEAMLVNEATGYNIYTKSYRNFKEFCKAMPTVQDVLNWYKTNKISGKTIKNGSTGPFIWPDEILEKKKAICFDTALFVYYYCKSKNIPSSILRIAGYYRGSAGELEVSGHGVGICKINGSWFAFDYFGSEPELASMFGPYPTVEDLTKAYKKRYRSLLEYREIKLEGGIASYVFTKEDLDKFDKIYGLKIGRDAFTYTIKGCYNARDREALKNGNYNLLDVILYQANVFRRLKDMFYNEAAIKLDKQGGYIDKYGNYKIKNSSTYDGMYTDVNEKEWLKKIKFKKLKDDKYSAKPQPVIYFGDEDFRARCEVIVFKDNKILIDRGKNRAGFGYSFPGGGIDPKESIATGARRECEEEALIYPKHIQFMNIAYKERFNNGVYNVGAISFVCVAEYGKSFSGKIADEDKDEFADRATWEDYRTANLGEPHKLAIERYLNKGVD